MRSSPEPALSSRLTTHEAVLANYEHIRPPHDVHALLHVLHALSTSGLSGGALMVVKEHLITAALACDLVQAEQGTAQTGEGVISVAEARAGKEEAEEGVGEEDVEAVPAIERLGPSRGDENKGQRGGGHDIVLGPAVPGSNRSSSSGSSGEDEAEVERNSTTASRRDRRRVRPC